MKAKNLVNFTKRFISSLLAIVIVSSCTFVWADEDVVESGSSINSTVNEDIINEDIIEGETNSESQNTESSTEVSSESLSEQSTEVTTESDVVIIEKETESTTNIFDSFVENKDVLQVKVKVELELNGGTLIEENWEGNSQSVVSGDKVTLPTPSQTGAVFMGWSDGKGSIYKANDEITVANDMKLFAQWQWEKYSVKFAKNPDSTAVWEVEMEYGYSLFTDRTLAPWENVQDSNWQEQEDGTFKASVDFGNNEIVDVTRHNDGNYNYYTFERNNTKWFTAPKEIIPENEGFTFRDWYMINPDAGGNLITSDTLYIARYIDTGGYIANVNFRYSTKKTAKESESYVLDYEKNNSDISFEFVAPILEGYYPVIKASSAKGVTLTKASGTANVGLDGVEDYTEVENNNYKYKLNINVDDTTFYTPNDEVSDEARIHFLTIDIEYHPAPVSFVERRFLEVLDNDPKAHSGLYELYEYTEVTYNEVDKKWDITSKRARANASYENNLIDNGEIQYYKYADGDYEVISQVEITKAEDGYYNGYVIKSEAKVYTGFVQNNNTSEILRDGYELKYQGNEVNLVYNRDDFTIYYITDSTSAKVENEVYVYGGQVSDPSTDPDFINKDGYILDTSKGTKGWIYYTDVPQDNSENKEILLNGDGLKPNSMPAMDIFAKAQWIYGDTVYNVNVYLESANYSDYVKEFNVTIGAKTGQVLNREDITKDIASYTGTESNTDGYDIIKAISNYNYNGVDFGDVLGKHFSFDADRTNNDGYNPEEIVVSGDGSSEINIILNRKWYVIEMILGRMDRYGNVDVATVTPGGFERATWTEINGADLPKINYNSNTIETFQTGDGSIYYKLKNGPKGSYENGDKKYLGAYGLYTDNLTINGYTCSAYYIYAKYDADLSSLWPASGGDVYIDDSQIINIAKARYVSMGTDANSWYITNSSNSNILNIYSSMDENIINDENGHTMSRYTGYEMAVNVDGKTREKATQDSEIIFHDNTVNHRLISYWNNPKTYRYYVLVELIDGSEQNNYMAEISEDIVGGAGAGKQTNLRLSAGNVVKYKGKYYNTVGFTNQSTTNTIENQNQPDFQGLVSLGKTFNEFNAVDGDGISGYVYFLYDRDRYTITLQNMDGIYYPPMDMLYAENSKLLKNGFNMTKVGEVNGVEYGQLTIKYTANISVLNEFRDYMINYQDDDNYDNKLALRYPIATTGDGAWEFDDWYARPDATTNVWGADAPNYTKSAYCNFILYGKWISPTYDVRFHMGRGGYSDSYRNEGHIWSGADTPSDNMAIPSLDGDLYTYKANEGEVVYVPYPPNAYGYNFMGWAYFKENNSDKVKVYIKDEIDENESLEAYKAGYTFYDSIGSVRLIEQDENGELFYYKNKVGLRHIFGQTSAIYDELDVYAVYASNNVEEYNVKHLIEKDIIEKENITPPNTWTLIDVNGVQYYQIQEDEFRNNSADGSYVVSPIYNLKVEGANGTNHFMLPTEDEVTLSLSYNLYEKAEVNGDSYTYNGDGNIFYVEKENPAENESRYRYYVVFKYSIETNVPYKVWYVDVDEAIRLGELTDENGDHPYFERDEVPENQDSVFLLPIEPKEAELDITNTTTVTETAIDIVGYTVLDDLQENMELLADGDKNNIYFYYKKQQNNATYNIKYYIMNRDSNEYDSEYIVEIQNMPAVSGTDIQAEVLGEYYERYISEALNNTTGVNGVLPTINVKNGNNNYTYNLNNGGADKDELLRICLEMFKGTDNEAENKNTFILVAANEADKEIDVYMRYGSIKVTKYDNDGIKLENAQFEIAQYNSNNEKTGVVYNGTTDRNGVYVFNGLDLDDEYKYELVETTAPSEDYLLLKEPIFVSLPFKSTEELNGEYDDVKDQVYYWYDINCDVTDSVKFDLPITGGKENVGIIVAGVGIIFIGITYILNSKKKKN